MFLKNHDEKSAVDLLIHARVNNFNNLGSILGKFFSKKFPTSLQIMEELAIMYHYTNKRDKAFFTLKGILEMRGLNELQSQKTIFNQHFSVSAVTNRYIHYNPIRMRSILERKNKKNTFPLITLTITSCKRFDLFQNTINSFVNCCKDIHLIDEWFCVDDNSSNEDRMAMKAFYPFIKFYFKSPEEKGHPQSMNIIKNYVKTPYTFHMEDDWQFFETKNYLSDCLEVLGQNPKIGQCLINKNYAEIASDHGIKGGEFKVSSSGLRYYIHQYCVTDKDKEDFLKLHGPGNSCFYWPHFSFRPSLLRTKIYSELGDFDTNISHFEMDYSYRYVKQGYISAFLEKTYCIHIGRLTSERNNKEKPNAYDLNNEIQFGDKTKKFPFRVKTFVINLDRRKDRMDVFNQKHEQKFLNCERFSAIDGEILIPTLQLQQIFDNNDYNMRGGMVGCAMSHIKLCIDLLKDNHNDVYCILEDDIDFVPGFKDKLLHCSNELNKTEWDLFYLGHHLWPQYVNEEVYSKTLMPKIEQMNTTEIFKKSIGGTTGYMINKKGAEKLLDYINGTGMTNGIDTVQQKSADVLNVFYSYPHLIYSECCTNTNTADTDIQNNYRSLTLSLEERLKEELKHYDIIKEVKTKDELDNINDSQIPYYYKSDDKEEIRDMKKKSKHPCYTLDDKILFVVYKDNGRFIHRFKKLGIWSVDEAIRYK